MRVACDFFSGVLHPPSLACAARSFILCLATKQFCPAGFEFWTWQVACAQGVVALRAEAVVEGNPEFKHLGIGWISVEHGKQSILRFCELAGLLIMTHQKDLCADRQRRTLQGEHE